MSTCATVGTAPPANIRLDNGSLCEERAAILAKRYDIKPEMTPGFYKVMTQIIEIYSDGTPRRTVASRQDVRKLKDALLIAKGALKQGGMLARLFDQPNSEEPAHMSGNESDRSTAGALVQLIDELLPVVKNASAKDGRTFAGVARRNAKARSAARLLHDFWVKDLRRGRSTQDRGGMESPGLRFILDCLRLFDRNAKASTIRGFGTFKRGEGH